MKKDIFLKEMRILYKNKPEFKEIIDEYFGGKRAKRIFRILSKEVEE